MLNNIACEIRVADERIIEFRLRCVCANRFALSPLFCVGFDLLYEDSSSSNTTHALTSSGVVAFLVISRKFPFARTPGL